MFVLTWYSHGDQLVRALGCGQEREKLQRYAMELEAELMGEEDEAELASRMADWVYDPGSIPGRNNERWSWVPEWFQDGNGYQVNSCFEEKKT